MTVWEPLPPRVSPGENSVDVWCIDLDIEPECLPALEVLLSAQEMDQARRFYFERDRRRYTVAHAALRSILARYLDDSTPQSIQFEVTGRGKPFLNPRTSLQFNLAHSHELALLAVTTLGEIGVDVEHIRPVEELDRLARTSFSEAEYQYFHSLPAAEAQRAFFHGWASKEAYIKALGEGLSHPLQKFSVSMDPALSARMITIQGCPDEAAQWTLESVDVGTEYSAAFAVRTTSVQQRCWNLRFKSELAYVSC